jgi:hypothetical protein
MIKGVLFNGEFMSDQASKKSGYSLKGDGGGKSEVIRKFKNGVQTRIRYEYRFPVVTDNTDDIGTLTGYTVMHSLRTDCNGLREIYNLGNSFYVIDRFPTNERSINNISFATSWNLPENTDSVPGSPGCFRGFLPNTGTIQSQIQIFVKGHDSSNNGNRRSYFLTQSMRDSIGYSGHFVNQLLFYNDMSANDFLISEISCIDGTENFGTISTDNYSTTSNVTVWEKIYSSGNRVVFILNPNKISYTYNNITSNGYVWLIHSDITGTVGNSRIFDYTNLSAPTHTITSQQGGQCEITL